VKYEQYEPYSGAGDFLATIMQCHSYLCMGISIPYDFSKYGQLAVDLYIHQHGMDPEITAEGNRFHKKLLEDSLQGKPKEKGLWMDDNFEDIFSWTFEYDKRTKGSQTDVKKILGYV